MESTEVKTLFEMDSYDNGKIKNEVFKSSIVSTEIESNEVSMELKKIQNDMKNHHFSKQHCVQYGISLIVTLSAFATGMQFGWVGPTLHKLMLNETNIQIDNSSGISWIADPINLSSFWIVLGVASLHQFCGFIVVLLYAQVILELADTPIDANLGGSILSAVGILVYFVSIISVDNWGRRPLLIISSITTAVSLIMIGLYFHLKRFNYEYISSFSIVPVIALILFKISYGLGIGPLFFVYSSEMFNTHFKSYAMCLLYSYMSLTNFIIVKMFYIISEVYGEFYSFYFFACCSLCGTIFSYFILPETKGKTLEEIQLILKRRI